MMVQADKSVRDAHRPKRRGVNAEGGTAAEHELNAPQFGAIIKTEGACRAERWRSLPPASGRSMRAPVFDVKKIAEQTR